LPNLFFKSYIEFLQYISGGIMTLTPAIAIERADAADLSAVLELVAALNLPQDGLAAHLGTALVARVQDKIVGVAALEVYGASALLRSVAVSPTAQGQGLGQRLVEAALAQAREQRIGQVYLLTETAAGFFPRFGFEIVGRHQVDEAVKQSVEFTSACPASAIVMVKKLV
jgi:amino-acid N-acetyltransferase